MFVKKPFVATLIALLLFAPLSFAKASEESKKTVQNNPIPVEDVQRFSTAMSHIKRYYVKQTKDTELFEHAIRGMLSGLDPHSGYLDIEDYKDLKTTTRGEFGGLGIEVTMENGFIKVISPIDDTPAHKAGIKAGDFIVRLNNKSVRNMTLRDAVTVMRGKRGTDIKILVLRKGEKKPLEFTLTRAVIRIQSVKSKLLDQKYAYVRVSHFQEPTVKDLKNAIEKLNKQANGRLHGLILDLRNNPGGLLNSAIQLSDLFIHNDGRGQQEMIVYTKGRLPGSEFKAYAKPGDVLEKAPMVVLINQGSASGSEIVAGALKDHKRAVIMGTKTFGKGSVQTVLPLDDKHGIKLTTALYYTPKGVSIQAAGVTPDIVVEEIKVPKPKQSTVQRLQEAHLNRHLDNGNDDKKAKKKKVSNKDSKELLYKDYQLYQALSLLKGMAILQR